MSWALIIVELHIFEVLELGHADEIVALIASIRNGLVSTDFENVGLAILCSTSAQM